MIAIMSCHPHITKGEEYSGRVEPCGTKVHLNFDDSARFGTILSLSYFEPTAKPSPEGQFVPPPVTLKPSNPKDAIGSSKLSMSVVPDSLGIYAAIAFTEGSGKYGGYNYRVAGVRASIYMDAAKRHMAKWWNGEDCDQVTHVPHLASVIACMGIILDADLGGKLTDDRPPAADIARLIESSEKITAHLRKLHANCKPEQYTQANLDAEQA